MFWISYFLAYDTYFIHFCLTFHVFANVTKTEKKEVTCSTHLHKLLLPLARVSELFEQYWDCSKPRFLKAHAHCALLWLIKSFLRIETPIIYHMKFWRQWNGACFSSVCTVQATNLGVFHSVEPLSVRWESFEGGR